MKKLSSFLFIIYSLSGCMEINTNDPQKAFEYWTQISEVNSEVNVINGKYWRSAHFTLEYNAFFKMTATKVWIENLINLNSLKIDSSYQKFNLNVPEWFTPSSDYVIYKSNTTNLSIWRHPNSDTIYIYDQ